MTSLKAITCVLSLLALSACSQPRNNANTGSDSDGMSTSSTDSPSALTYDYTDPATACSTGLRSYKSLADVCLNLQISVNNNNCAADQRQARYANFCTGAWSPANALSVLTHATGLYMACDFTSTDSKTHIATTIHQETSSTLMILSLNNATATVAQSLRNEFYNIGAIISANDGSARTQKAQGAKNSAPLPLTVDSSNSTLELHLVCAPTLEPRQ